MLCVRGSESANDWALNSDSEPAIVELAGRRCVARRGMLARSFPPAAWHCLFLLDRYAAHRGMLAAARAILDDCGCRAALDVLRHAG